jgi:hypothetical protein
MAGAAFAFVFGCALTSALGFGAGAAFAGLAGGDGMSSSDETTLIGGFALPWAAAFPPLGFAVDLGGAGAGLAGDRPPTARCLALAAAGFAAALAGGVGISSPDELMLTARLAGGNGMSSTRGLPCACARAGFGGAGGNAVSAFWGGTCMLSSRDPVTSGLRSASLAGRMSTSIGRFAATAAFDGGSCFPGSPARWGGRSLSSSDERKSTAGGLFPPADFFAGTAVVPSGAFFGLSPLRDELRGGRLPRAFGRVSSASDDFCRLFPAR